jgi:hypothetical protein
MRRMWRGKLEAGLCTLLVAFGVVLVPARGWSQPDAASLWALPLVSLEEQAAPVVDCEIGATQSVTSSNGFAGAGFSAPHSGVCAAPRLGFSAAGAPVNFMAAGFSWTQMLGRFWYLAAGVPALFLLGGHGGGGGGGLPIDALGTPSFTDNDRPAQSPVPEPASIALFVGGSALVGAALRRRRQSGTRA